ncbi:hypothetical protein RHSIM_Rhsim13G0106600 [Rhododendron simsii]|uniref:Uncharacterized protein n=1 Tax=Rhododendron simsii TaxID=118357 RepID=A0A834L6W2_RHOSS|nr:hypothetical protein RHSIM_Rhsim13G0106600 [Rhododendron simsii]
MEEKAETDHHHHHVITIEEVEEMEEKIKEIPKLLNRTAGKKSCCIFRVPQSLVEINGKAYHPLILSIGPYHYGKPHLNMIEEHKWKFLGELLARTPPDGLKLDGYLKIIAPLETRIRDCYSEFIDINTFDLIKMMVLDGLFIIELISRVGNVAPSDRDDPIFNMAWIFPFLMRDLLRLENQIPFFVLQTLFESTRVTRSCGDDQTLAKLILGCFNYIVERSDGVLERFRDLEGKHLLDFFRLSFIPPHPPQPKPRKKANCFIARKNDIPLLQLIPSAKKLDKAGIKFEAKKGDTFLEIRFHNGVLEIPQISIDDFTTWFLLNSVVFEQCYKHCSKHMTAYACFIGCLISNPSDAGFLGDRKIVENYVGTDKELAHFFNDLGKDVSFDIANNYLSKVFEDVNEYQRNGWHVQWAGFKYTYFQTPWSFISALAALILLLLNMILAFFALYPYAGGKVPG